MSRARPSRRVLWWPRRRSVVFDVLVVLGVTALVLWVATDVIEYRSPELRAFALSTVPVATLPLIVRRRWPIVPVVAAVGVILIGYDIFLITVALYSLARYGKSERRLIAVSVLVAALIVVSDYYNPIDITQVYDGDEDSPAVPWVIVVPFSLVAVPVLLGVYLKARNRLLEELQERADRLEREQHLLAAQALAEERSRIAREMHDVVAHQVGLAVIYSGALEVSTDTEPAETARLARQVGDANRQALRELREVIGVLRLAGGTPEDPLAPQPTLGELPELVSESLAAGLPVRLRVEGPEVRLPGNVQRTIYRIVQESLSNVHKHAGMVETEVLLRYEAEFVTVRVHNAPPARPVDVEVPSGGHGLIGMRERISLVQGVFEAGRRPDGSFHVHARIPVTSTTATDEAGTERAPG
ncbi:sensor histidine kinase [Saccharopolyspora erythraea]|uniref:sensor histidine kinase n=1 Tax=Saccharopolyspora erythraea TaxID=1836 RepID=UPI002011623F|nr:histidine kinase [Saccharopolyspora erythraea]